MGSGAKSIADEDEARYLDSPEYAQHEETKRIYGELMEGVMKVPLSHLRVEDLLFIFENERTDPWNGFYSDARNTKLMQILSRIDGR